MPSSPPLDLLITIIEGRPYKNVEDITSAVPMTNILDKEKN